MDVQALVADMLRGVLSGYLGTKVMEPVSIKLYEWEPAAARQQEDAVRPGPPYQIAAQKTTKLLGMQLTDQQLEQAGMLFHYGLGMSWGPVYTLLRRFTPLHPLLAGLLTGTAMSLIVDEGLSPALGFSAPNRAYPLVTHLRGFAAHLAYGLGVAATVELLVWLGRQASQRPLRAEAPL